MIEEWKDVQGYEGIYRISSLGRVLSLRREFIRRDGVRMVVKERSMKQYVTADGYFRVALSRRGSDRKHLVHVLVWDAFGQARRGALQVDHIDEVKSNNNIGNLQLLTNRQNVSKHQWGIRGRYTSKYVGVFWSGIGKKWSAQIRLDGEKKHLGMFTSEEEAYLAYQKALKAA